MSAVTSIVICGVATTSADNKDNSAHNSIVAVHAEQYYGME